MRRRASGVIVLPVALVCAGVFAGAIGPKRPLDKAAERWIDETRNKLTLDEKIGQLIVPSFESGYLSTDTDAFDELARLVRDYRVGGFHRSEEHTSELQSLRHLVCRL